MPYVARVSACNVGLDVSKSWAFAASHPSILQLTQCCVHGQDPPALSASETRRPAAFRQRRSCFSRRPGRASLLGSSQRRSQPASGGSSLCCAGQRRRHAEHRGRLLLHRSGGRGPRGCGAGLLHLLTSGRAVGRLPNRSSAGRHHSRAAGLLHLLTSGRPVGRLPHGKRAGHADAGRHHRTRTSSQPTKSPRRWWRTVRPQTRTRQRPRASQPRCSATTPSHKWTVCWPTSSASRRQPLPCK